MIKDTKFSYILEREYMGLTSLVYVGNAVNKVLWDREVGGHGGFNQKGLDSSLRTPLHYGGEWFGCLHKALRQHARFDSSPPPPMVVKSKNKEAIR